MKTFERQEDCPPVERLIWDKVSVSYGDFNGIEELSFADLLALRSACDFQAQKMFNESSEEN